MARKATTARTAYYECDGSVRGSCGRRHRTIAGARRCLEADQAGCRRQGGYSDRRIWRVSPGGARSRV